MELRERRLRAGVQPVAACRHHHALQEHAVVEPAALPHDAVDGEDQADRRVEEAVVALVLFMHALLVSFADAQQRVQVPAHLAPAVDIRRHPLGGVVGVLLGVAGTLGGVIEGGAHAVAQALAGVAHQHVHPPGLGVGARGRPGSHLQDVLDLITRHRRGQERADRPPGGDGGLDGGGGFGRNAGCHGVLSKGCKAACRAVGRGAGRRVARSTYTCTKCPAAADRGSP